MSVPFTWLDKVDARVRVVDCMCKVCATHVTSNMHPAAACRDSCDNPILVKSSWTSYWLPLGSLNTCVNNGAFAMQALAGCNLLLKCCGTSSVKWRVLLTSAVLGLSSSEVLFFLASLSLWISLEFLRYCSSLTFWDYYNYSSSKLFVFEDFRPDLFRWLGPIRCCNAAFGRSRWGDGGIKVGHEPATVKGL